MKLTMPTDDDSSSFDEENQNEELPADQDIINAIKILSKTVDLEDISFKEFAKMIAANLDCDEEGLLAKKKTLIKARMVLEAKNVQEAPKNNEAILPSDSQIIKAAKTLAWSPKIDMDTMTHAKFLKRLSKKMKVDLTPKKGVVFRALDSCKAEMNEAIPVFDASPNSKNNRGAVQTAKVIEVVSTDSSKKYPNGAKSLPKIKRDPGMHYSHDLEQGRRIPQAADLSWEDNFFDKETDDLVAVFDHDYVAMFQYHMKKILLTRTLPWFIGLVVLSGFMLAASESASDIAVVAGLVLFDVGFVLLLLHGNYRLIKSQVYALHMAVARDGVKAVYDKHLEGWAISAALHMWDSCLLVTRQDETIPFDKVTKVTVKCGGEISDDIGCCCMCCCGVCLKIPFDHLALDTGSSSPQFFEADLIGLKEPRKAHDLIWAMKREKGEQIHLDNRDANIESASLLRQLVANSQQRPQRHHEKPLSATSNGSDF